MPHPNDDKVTLSPEELEAAYRRHWDEYMEGFHKIAAEHADELNAVRDAQDKPESMEK